MKKIEKYELTMMGVIFSILLLIPITNLKSEENYYVLLGTNLKKHISSEKRMYVKYSLNRKGWFQKKNKLGKDVKKLLIGAGSSGPNDWRRKEFRENYKNSIGNLFESNPGIQEIQLDFEFFNRKYAQDFSNFSCFSRKVTNTKNRKLSLALFPPHHPDNKGFHDFSILVDCADFFYLMMYDMHNPRTGPGRITSSDWIEKNLKTIVNLGGKKVISKLVLGLPLYGYSWDSRGKFKKTYSFRSLPQTGSSNISQLVIKKNANETIYTSTKQFNKYWIEQAKRMGLKGVIFWRYGFD